MARISVLCLRLMAVAFAGALLLLCVHGARAQMVGGGSFQPAPGSQPIASTPPAPVAQPSSRYSNPYSNMGVSQPLGLNGQPDPYAYYGGQAGAPPGMYAAPLGYGAQTSGAAYGAQGEPGAPPSYSIEAAQPLPQNAPQPNPQYAPPPQYAPQPQYTPPYVPPPQYQPQPQPAQYTQPQPAPQYAQPQATPYPPAGPAPLLSPYAAVRANAAAIAGPTGEGGYTLGPGDKVRLTVFDEPDLSGEYQVDGNGNIRLPLVGVVRAAGNTAQSLEASIRALLSPNYLRNPRLNVDISAYRPIYVVGQVTKPGQYPYLEDMTMLNAISLAGGFTSQSKQSMVYVRHEGETRETPVSTDEPLLIRPGDTVRVDTTLFWDAMNLFSPLSSPAAVAAAVARP